VNWRASSGRSRCRARHELHRYAAEHNADPKPFTRTKTPQQILAKLNSLNASVH
jgi:hypothetical protein